MSRSNLKWFRDLDLPEACARPTNDAERVARVQEIERRHREEGGLVKDLIAEAGISAWTYYHWKRRLVTAKLATLRPVVVIEPAPPQPAPSQPVLISPSGYRVAGLDVSTLLQILRVVG